MDFNKNKLKNRQEDFVGNIIQGIKMYCLTVGSSERDFIKDTMTKCPNADER